MNEKNVMEQDLIQCERITYYKDYHYDSPASSSDHGPRELAPLGPYLRRIAYWGNQ